MRSLSKLVNLNNPDLVLFVGEALVGNDSIDQVCVAVCCSVLQCVAMCCIVLLQCAIVCRWQRLD